MKLHWAIYVIIGIIAGIYLSGTDDRDIEPVKPADTPAVVQPRRRNVVVMNQPTRHVGEYDRIGHLHSTERQLLPLYGRQLYRGSSVWQYYTMSDGNIPIRLTFQNDGRNCGSEYGCRELNDGGTVYIEEYGVTFTASIERPYMRYNHNTFM